MEAADPDSWMPAWMALVRTYGRYWDFIEAAMHREHGLTMARYDVLAQLDLAGGRLGLGDLATHVWLSPSGVSKLLDRMSAAGLVMREPDPDDARSSFAVITRAGEALVRRARRTHHALLGSTFGTLLSDRDRADVVRAMERLSEALGSSPRASRARTE
ncbi:MAG TPA: MarR family transcriptional regulator [Candidatus Acidoferrales bacterium]|nr:MarR family transcriptional regulator [Candidatus Acidoferrales bacterium]